LGQLQVVMGNASRITGRPELIPDHWHKNNQSESFKG